MAYTRNPQWKDHPDTSTPITAAKLENIEQGVTDAATVADAAYALAQAGGGSGDHGALTGLADDDHTQYALANGTRGNFASVTQGQNGASAYGMLTGHTLINMAGMPATYTLTGLGSLVTFDPGTTDVTFDIDTAGVPEGRTVAFRVLGDSYSSNSGNYRVKWHANVDVISWPHDNLAEVWGNLVFFDSQWHVVAAEASWIKPNANIDLFNSMWDLLTGANNVTIGEQAARLTTTGGHNVGVGTFASYNLTTGSRNVAVGNDAGVHWDTPTIDDTVSVGTRAASKVAGGVALGLDSDVNAGHTASVALGSGTQTNAANQVAIGARDLEVQDSTKGIVLKSPDGTRYRVTVANGGTLSVTAA